MGKTRVHLLAKELGIETKDLIAQLDKLGMRGRKAQSSLEDDEVARIRAALAAQEKPHIHVGEEKVVVDRVVKAEEEGHGGIEAHETVVERRVRANVIRRRTSRVEVAAAETAEAAQPQVAESAPALAEPEIPPMPVEEISTLTPPESETPVELEAPPEAVVEAVASLRRRRTRSPKLPNWPPRWRLSRLRSRLR